MRFIRHAAATVMFLALIACGGSSSPTAPSPPTEANVIVRPAIVTNGQFDLNF